MERRDVAKAMLVLLGGRDVAEAGSDPNLDAVPVERREGVLEADPELPDHLLGVAELLAILVLGEVLVPKPATEVADVPPTIGVLADLGLGVPVKVASSRAFAISSGIAWVTVQFSRTRSTLRSNSRVGRGRS
jgi:hypothetical protein